MGRLLNFIFKKKREDFQKLTKERSEIFKLPDDAEFFHQYRKGDVRA